MANVFDVAKYILEKLGTLSTMKLQKLCYYCQAWSLVWDDTPLFDEKFEAWANGPVCPQLFQKHKGLFAVDESLFADIPDYPFTSDQIETMNTVLDYYGNRQPQWLSELTHKELGRKLEELPQLENSVTILLLRKACKITTED